MHWTWMWCDCLELKCIAKKAEIQTKSAIGRKNRYAENLEDKWFKKKF